MLFFLVLWLFFCIEIFKYLLLVNIDSLLIINSVLVHGEVLKDLRSE
jgi:hypothetical protein